MRLPRWKREQRQRRFRKLINFLKLTILIFVLVSLGGATLLVGRLWQSSPLPKEGRTTIVLASDPILLLSLAPEGELLLLSIPGETFVETTRGFGSYRLGAIFDLGEQEKMGGRLLAETAQEFLGAPVDGWVGFKNEKLKIKNEKLEREKILAFKNDLTSWRIVLRPKELLGTVRDLETNLTVFDLARVWWQVKFTRFDKIQFVDLGKSPGLTTLVLADGSLAKTFDRGLLDSGLAGLFRESKFIGENVLIEVLNGTDKPGLANRVARLITNLGGSLVSVSNSPQNLSNCRIRGEDKALQTFTSQRLVQIYHCQKEVGKQDSRADVQILIGEDYWRKLFQK